MNTALQMYAIATRFLVVTKAARSKTEIQLNAKLNKLFQTVENEMVAAYERSGVPDNAALVVGNYLTEMDEMLLDYVMDEVTFAGTPEQIIQDSTFDASKRTLDNMKGNVNETIARGLSEGLSSSEIAVDLRSNFKNMADWELRRIAHAEVHHAQSLNRYEEFRAAGVGYSQWITAKPAPNIRSSHEAIHNQIARLGDRFSNGLRYPGDRSGPIEEWINCRCSAAPWILPPGKLIPAGKGVDYVLKWFYEKDLVDEKKVERVVTFTAEEKAEHGFSHSGVIIKPWDKYENMSAKAVKQLGTSNLRKMALDRGLPSPVVNSLSGQQLRAIIRNPSRLDEILEQAAGKATKLKTKAVASRKPTKKIDVLDYFDDLDLMDQQALSEGIDVWTGAGYSRIRDAQMGIAPMDEATRRYVSAIEEAAEKVIPYHGTTHRGIFVDRDDWQKLNKQIRQGKTVRFDAMTSTSKNLEVAEGFGEPYMQEYSVMMHFENTKSGLDLEEILVEILDQGNREEEVLFMKGSKFQVTSKVNNKHSIQDLLDNDIIDEDIAELYEDTGTKHLNIMDVWLKEL